VRALPFEEVIELYHQATRELVGFLRIRWPDLSAKQRQDFQVPLKHRRHHRLLLERALQVSPEAEPLRQQEGHA